MSGLVEIPLRMINQWAYCPRRFWIMFVHGEMVENAAVVEGRIQHERVHEEGQRLAAGVRLYRNVSVVSPVLGLFGRADQVECGPDGWRVVEYKRGRQGKWHNDALQLCAQAMCLEDMYASRGIDVRVDRGEVFYWGSRRRVKVIIDANLRASVKSTVAEIRSALASGQIPKPVTQRKRCEGCSVKEICLPDEVAQLANARGGVE